MDILLALIAVLIPTVATYIALQVAKGLIPFVDRLPGLIKQFVAIAFAYGAAFVSEKIGVPFPAELAGLADPTAVAAILSGLASWLLYPKVKASLKAA